MRVTRAAATRTCAICERTLLMGEHAVRYSPGGREYVDVCPLCQDVALEHGWVREGSPTTPTVPRDLRRPVVLVDHEARPHALDQHGLGHEPAGILDQHEQQVEGPRAQVDGPAIHGKPPFGRAKLERADPYQVHAATL